jgi:hypothetical protein
MNCDAAIDSPILTTYTSSSSNANAITNTTDINTFLMGPHASKICVIRSTKITVHELVQDLVQYRLKWSCSVTATKQDRCDIKKAVNFIIETYFCDTNSQNLLANLSIEEEKKFINQIVTKIMTQLQSQNKKKTLSAASAKNNTINSFISKL